MKASEMTNDELAKALMRRVPLDSNNHDDIREAAARLRKIDTYCAVNERQDIDNAKLRANLKVAEDALEKCVNYNNSWELEAAKENAKNALHAIHGKGANNDK